MWTTFLKNGVAFTSYDDFVERMDALLRCQSLWIQKYLYCKDCAAEYQWTSHVFHWQRDTMTVLQEILENTALADKCVWKPDKVFNVEGERVYSSLEDSDWWMEKQVYTPCVI